MRVAVANLPIDHSQKSTKVARLADDGFEEAKLLD